MMHTRPDANISVDLVVEFLWAFAECPDRVEHVGYRDIGTKNLTKIGRNFLCSLVQRKSDMAEWIKSTAMTTAIVGEKSFACTSPSTKCRKS